MIERMICTMFDPLDSDYGAGVVQLEHDWPIVGLNDDVIFNH
jgi:hypothetical protein